MEENMIEVLWIDDECIKNDGSLTTMGQEFIEMADLYNIRITPMLSYSEGIKAIESNPLRYCAVILDIHNQAATGKPSDDFDDAKDRIKVLQGINHQNEPYIFILSGNKQYKTESSTIRKPEYCKKNIYDKNGEDYKILFSDIQQIQNVSKIYACQAQHNDILKIAKDISENTYKSLLELLYIITVNGEKKNADLFNKMRKILENIMLKLRQHEYSFFFNSRGDDTLNNLSKYIGEDISIPEYIKRAFHTLTRIVQDGSHSEDISNRLRVDSDVSNLRAPYLLRSSLYELCNILIWVGSLDREQ